jgi:hypothetical protein
VARSAYLNCECGFPDAAITKYNKFVKRQFARHWGILAGIAGKP